jgi:hypothetical protein
VVNLKYDDDDDDDETSDPCADESSCLWLIFLCSCDIAKARIPDVEIRSGSPEKCGGFASIPLVL